MALDLAGNTINRIKIVDDKADVRKIIAINVEEAQLEPVLENGPLPPLEEFISTSITNADAAICDHRLSLGTYAQFNGAEAVAQFYKHRWPALLCTTWSPADIDAMRQYLRKIPVLIHTDELDPDAIAEGFEYCIREFNNEFLPNRRPWRTLVRVEEVDKEMAPPMFFVVLSGWHSSDKIRLPLNIIPPKLQSRIKPGIRLHAQVNKGAESQENLYFESFEFD